MMGPEERLEISVVFAVCRAPGNLSEHAFCLLHISIATFKGAETPFLSWKPPQITAGRREGVLTPHWILRLRINSWDTVLNFQKNPGMPERRATLQMLKGLLWHKMGFGVVPSHKGKAVVLWIRRIEGEASASIGHGSERIIISLGSWETANRNPQTGGW